MEDTFSTPTLPPLSSTLQFFTYFLLLLWGSRSVVLVSNGARSYFVLYYSTHHSNDFTDGLYITPTVLDFVLLAILLPQRPQPTSLSFVSRLSVKMCATVC